MDSPKKKGSKDLIPKNAQIVLLIIGIPLLAFASIRLATQMGWIGGPPKAKTDIVKKEDKPKPPPEAGAPKPATPGPRLSASGRTRREGPADLESIQLPDRDPLADLGGPPPAASPGAGAATSGRPKPPAPSPTPSSVPPLPPPLPTPTSTGPFPSPVTGGGTALPPGMVPRRSQERGLPPALAASYPLLRRGGRAGKTASVSLVGTISGPEGSLAVVRPADAAGAHGRYVRPGQLIDGREGEQVKAISPGKVTIGTRGRTQELSLPTPESESGGSSAESAGAGGPADDDKGAISPPTR